MNEKTTIKEQTDKDRLYKILFKCTRNHAKPDVHSFVANVINGRVFVDCRRYEIYMKTIVYDAAGNEYISEFAGPMIAVYNRLLNQGIDVESIEI